jgi:CHASE2 domain-containing sensor protein
MAVSLPVIVVWLGDSAVRSIERSEYAHILVYQSLVNIGRSADIISNTAIVEIDPSKEFSRASSRNACGTEGQRQFLAKLLVELGKAHPREIVLDKAPRARDCPANDPGTQALIQSIRQLRVSIPVIVGIEADKNTSVLIEPLPLSNTDQEGLINISPADSRFLPLSYSVYPFSHKDDVPENYIVRESLALVSARIENPAKIKKNARLQNYLQGDGEPLIGFAGPMAWSEAGRHFTAGEVICGQKAQTDSDWNNCGQLSIPISDVLHQSVVIVGESGAKDIHPSVVGPVEGFYLQANYIEALIDNRFLVAFPAWASWLIALFLFVFLFVMKLRAPSIAGRWLSPPIRRHDKAIVFMGFVVVIISVYTLNTGILIAQWHVYLDPFPFLAMPLSAWLLDEPARFVKKRLMRKGRTDRTDGS